MNKPLITCWISLAFLLASGIVAQILRSDIPWKGEEAAAWVQAVGSVAAIAVAIYLSREESRRRRADDAEARAGALEVIAHIGFNATNAISQGASMLNVGPVMNPGIGDEIIGLESAREAIDRLPLATLNIPAGAVASILELRSYVVRVHGILLSGEMRGAFKPFVDGLAERSRVICGQLLEFSNEARAAVRQPRK